MSETLGASGGGQFIGIGFDFITSQYFRIVQPYLGIYLVLRRYVWRKSTDKPGARIKLGTHFKRGNLVSALTQASLAKKAGVSVSTAKRAVWALEQAGWLQQLREVTKRGNHNVLLLGHRTKTKGIKEFTGESYLANTAISLALAAEKKQKEGGEPPSPGAPFKTRTSKDYRAELALRQTEAWVTSDPSLDGGGGVTSDPTPGVTCDPTPGVTSDPTYNRELTSTENLCNIHLPTEDGARKRALEENAPWGSSRAFLFPRPSGAADERNEQNKQHNESAPESTTRAAPEMVPNCITQPDAVPVRVDVALCASGDAPSEGAMAESEEQRQARLAKRKAQQGGTPPVRPVGPEAPADGGGKRGRGAMSEPDGSEAPKGRGKGKRAAKGSAGGLEASPDGVPSKPKKHPLENPWELYTHFRRVVHAKWPGARLAPHNPNILRLASYLIQRPDKEDPSRMSGFCGDDLFEMIQVLVLDFENFPHAKIFLKTGGLPYPTFEQFCANTGVLYPLVGQGVVGIGAGRVSYYAEDYRQRQGNLGAQPASTPTPTDAKPGEAKPDAATDVKSIVEQLRAQLRTEAAGGNAEGGA